MGFISLSLSLKVESGKLPCRGQLSPTTRGGGGGSRVSEAPCACHPPPRRRRAHLGCPWRGGGLGAGGEGWGRRGQPGVAGHGELLALSRFKGPSCWLLAAVLSETAMNGLWGLCICERGGGCPPPFFPLYLSLMIIYLFGFGFGCGCFYFSLLCRLRVARG